MAKRKLTNATADLIRAEYAATKTTQRVLAKKYGVSQMAVWQVLNGKTFRPREGRVAA